MHVGRLWLIPLILAMPAAAFAHGHSADFYGGPSFGNGSTLRGFQIGLGITSPQPTNRDLSVIADLGVHFGSHDNQDVTRVTSLGGVRWTVPGTRHKNLAFVQVLGGAMHNATAVDRTKLTGGFGGGYEFLPDGDTSEGGWAFRVQADYLRSDDRNFGRVTFGLSYRIQ